MKIFIKIKMYKFDKLKEYKFDNEYRKIDYNIFGVILWNSDFICS